MDGDYLGYRGTIILFKIRQENKLIHFTVKGIPFPQIIFKIICRAHNYIIIADPTKSLKSFRIKLNIINENTLVYEEIIHDQSAFKIRISKIDKKNKNTIIK